MKSIKFKLNNKIEVIQSDGGYKCTIQDVGEDYISINLPVKDGRYLLLNTGDYVECMYYYNNELFKFSTSVIGREVSNILLIKLSMPEKIVRHQRRRSVRVPVLMRINFTLICKEKEQTKEETATLLDISGSGMRFTCDRVLQVSDKILVRLPLNNGQAVKLNGKVVRVYKEDTSLNINSYGVSFIDNDKMDIEKVIKFVFENIRKQRKNGI